MKYKLPFDFVFQCWEFTKKQGERQKKKDKEKKRVKEEK